MASENEPEDGNEDKGDNKARKGPAVPAQNLFAIPASGHGVDVDCSCAVALGILYQEAVQATGLMLFNNVHNQQLGQMAEQAAAMKGIIELHRSGATPACKLKPPPKESNAGGSDECKKTLAELLHGILGLSNGVPDGGGNNNGSGTSGR